MKTLLRMSVCVVVAIVSLSSCSLNPGFNQLDLLKRWASYETKAEIEAQLWTLKIGDYEQVVIPVVHESSMTFYSKDGTEVDFSGWDVTALRNWNQYGKGILVNRIGDSLNHRFLDGSELALTCTEYEQISDEYLQEGSIRSASCIESAGGRWSYKNAVVMDDQGRAIWMLHYISPDMPPIELRLNGSDEAKSEGFDITLLER